jgi:hypothetical protein
MLELAAVRSALYLFHMPSAVRQARGGPLPDGMSVLLEIAAGEEPVIRSAAELLERPPQVLNEAAAFFIEQVLMAPESDSYRVLGASRNSSSADLRRNMALLLRWAHPDADRLGGARAAVASRVIKAWENFKTQDRRDNYDAAHPVREVRSRGSGSRRASAGHGAVASGSGVGPVLSKGATKVAGPGILRRTLARLFRRSR